MLNYAKVVHCKKEPYDVYIGRPSKWGNPFEIGKDGNRQEVIEKYRQYLFKNPHLVKEAQKELKGKTLACWCAPQACHGDILLEIANQDMITKIISGGQTGADIGGLLAAKLWNVETGGWMPNGWITQNGNHPEYATLFGMKEYPQKGYKERTWANVKDSDGTIRFAVNFNSPGEICTLNAIKALDKPYLDININKESPMDSIDTKTTDFIHWMKNNKIKTLNVAGNSHKTWIGMQSFVIQFFGIYFYDMLYYLPRQGT